MLLERWTAAVMGFAVWLTATTCTVAQEVDAAAGAGSAGDAAAGSPDPQATAEEPQGPQAGKPWIGVQLARPEEALRQQLGLGEGLGFVITEVFPDSPAAAAGVEKFDVVVEAAGQPLKEDHDLSKVVKAAGDKAVQLGVIRHGQAVVLKVTPKPAPAPPEPTWTKLLVSGLGQVDPLRTELPEGVEVEIKKSGSDTAHITVQRGRMIWEMIPGDSLERLPEDIRGPVASLLGRSEVPLNDLPNYRDLTIGGLEGTVHLYSAPADAAVPAPTLVVPHMAPGASPPRPAAPVRPSPSSLEKQLDDIARRLDAIEKSLGEKK